MVLVKTKMSWLKCVKLVCSYMFAVTTIQSFVKPRFGESISTRDVPLRLMK